LREKQSPVEGGEKQDAAALSQNLAKPVEEEFLVNQQTVAVTDLPVSGVGQPLGNDTPTQ